MLVLSGLSAMAQESYLSIGLGAALPQSDFGTDNTLMKSGYAMSGFAIELEGTYFPGSIVGVSGMMGFGSFYTLQNEYYMNLTDYINERTDLPGFNMPMQDQTDYTIGFWNYVNFLVGPELSVPFWRMQVGLKLMGGASVLISPKREINYVNNLDILKVSTKGSDLSLSYLYGGSLMYKLRTGTALRFSADYLSTKASYTFDFLADTPLADIDESMKNTLNIQSLQLLVGLSYTF